jgi:hypothetical protein
MESTLPQPRLSCSGCGDVIGVYEPAWVEAADGSLHPSSLLNLDETLRRTSRRIWHGACVIDDYPPEDPNGGLQPSKRT